MHGRGRVVGVGHVWQGMCAWQEGGMHGRRGHAWQEGASVAGDVCMAGGHACQEGGVHVGGHAQQERWPLQQTARILLECTLIDI